MIEEGYVDFELARKLKDLGFPQDSSYKGFILPWDSELTAIDNDEIHRCYEYDEYIAAPTLYQAHKWLRKEKGVQIEIESTMDFERNYFMIVKKQADGHGEMIYNSMNDDLALEYESALKVGIRRALDEI